MFANHGEFGGAYFGGTYGNNNKFPTATQLRITPQNHQIKKFPLSP